ncbi:hypothetical protein E6O75_ATG05862 [Venturia nashicola]|uniref:Uncharacterized protein n=1 Tax=Venturia nashicola TaxID=86259 RepID=A0A4Z1PAW6_9PEZI|nr:hypothetical protein E6O75_ATG05862 [Venturia nashicola]
MRLNATTVLTLILAIGTTLVTSHPATNDSNPLMENVCPFKCKPLIAGNEPQNMKDVAKHVVYGRDGINAIHLNKHTPRLVNSCLQTPAAGLGFMLPSDLYQDPSDPFAEKGNASVEGHKVIGTPSTNGASGQELWP